MSIISAVIASFLLFSSASSYYHYGYDYNNDGSNHLVLILLGVIMLVLPIISASITYRQGGRTWQAFGGGKNGHETFRQARIYNFRDKCVVFARNLKFSNLTQ